MYAQYHGCQSKLIRSCTSTEANARKKKNIFSDRDKGKKANKAIYLCVKKLQIENIS